MNIIRYQKLKEKYKGLSRGIEDIKEITLHGTGGGTAQGILAWMSSDTCERAENYKKSIGLFPYEIDRNGDIYELMQPELWYYHSDADEHDKSTIGIELVNPLKNNHGVYTEDQYKALFDLIMYLMSKFPGIETISGHDYNALKYSGLHVGHKLHPYPCPGPMFDWLRLRNYLENHGYGFQHEDLSIQNIHL